MDQKPRRRPTGGSLHLATAAGGRAKSPSEHSLPASLGPDAGNPAARTETGLRLSVAFLRRAGRDGRGIGEPRRVLFAAGIFRARTEKPPARDVQKNPH